MPRGLRVCNEPGCPTLTINATRCPAHRRPRLRSPSSRATGRRDWRRTRDRILARDDRICQLCGQPGADTVDHIIPVSKGGTNNDDNLRAAHQRCNSRRGVG